MVIQDMVETLGKLDATNQSSEAAIADFILNNLKMTKKQRPNDKTFIVIAIQAYAKMLQDNDVKVVDYQI
jgi:hypothetical protein